MDKKSALYIVLSLIAVWFFYETRDPQLDYYVYTRVARNGDPFYYCYWIWPVVWIIDTVFKTYGLIVWNLMNVAGVGIAARLWKNNLSVLISFQALYYMRHGNMVGLMALGFALVGWGLENKRWQWVGVGLVLAVIKPGTSFLVVLYLWASSGASWRDLAKTLIIPSLVFAASLAIYGLWPLEAIEFLRHAPPIDGASMTLWQWFGPIVMFLWLPIIFLPLPRMERVCWITACTALAITYYPQSDLTVIMTLPIGWPAALASILGYTLYPVLWYNGLKLIVIAPLLWYCTLFVKAWKLNQPYDRLMKRFNRPPNPVG